jgi:hypothetical protein
MDWASVVSVAITGAVGIAGVAGTILAARITSKSATENLKLSISADNERARLALKRGVYADCLTAFAEMMTAVFTFREHHSGDDHDVTRTKQSQTQVVMIQKISEVRLIAPRNVARAVAELGQTLLEYAIDSLRVEPFGTSPEAITKKLHEVYQVMRADLGESVETDK